MPPQTPSQTQPLDRYFLGVQQARSPEWERYYAVPQATRSSKPDSVANEVTKKREKQTEKAHRFAFGGYVSSLVLMNWKGECILRLAASSPSDGEQLASTFVAFIQSLPEALGLTPYDDLCDCRVKWFGFDIREVMQQLAFTALAMPAPKPYVPPGMWYHRNFEPAPFIDPYDALVPTTLRDDVDVYALIERLCGTSIAPADLADASGRAAWARALVVAAQLCWTP